jgi:hypothetical protein
MSKKGETEKPPCCSPKFETTFQRKGRNDKRGHRMARKKDILKVISEYKSKYGFSKDVLLSSEDAEKCAALAKAKQPLPMGVMEGFDDDDEPYYYKSEPLGLSDREMGTRRLIAYLFATFLALYQSHICLRFCATDTTILPQNLCRHNQIFT